MTQPTRQHDFIHTEWGRSWYVRGNGQGKMSGLTHCTPRPQEGDTAVWETAYGTAVGRFDSVLWKGDPADMYEVELTIIERRDHEGRALDPETGERLAREGGTKS